MPEIKFGKVSVEVGRALTKTNFWVPSIGKSDYGKIEKSLSSAIFNRNFTKKIFRGFLWLNMPEIKFGKVWVEVGRAMTKTNFWVPQYRQK